MSQVDQLRGSELKKLSKVFDHVLIIIVLVIYNLNESCDFLVLCQAEKWKAISYSVFNVAPIFACGVTFAFFTLILEKKNLDLPTAFVVLSWFGVITESLIMLPRYVTLI